MHDTDWTVWLGPAADDMTEEQRDRFDAEAREILDRYPDEDDNAERDAALAVTAQHLLGETTIDEAGHALGAARLAASEALAVAQQIARLAVLDGMSEVQAGRRAGIDRMTVRKMLGKR